MLRHIVLALCVSLAACARQPPSFDYAGVGIMRDPLQQDLYYASRNLGDMSVYRGRPGMAALACAQYQAILAGLANNQEIVTPPGSLTPLAASGDREMRAALGIPADTPPRAIVRALRMAAAGLHDGDRSAALAALSQPFFTLGPEATLARLADLPPMPAVESAAPLMTQIAEGIYAAR